MKTEKKTRKWAWVMMLLSVLVIFWRLGSTFLLTPKAKPSLPTGTATREHTSANHSAVGRENGRLTLTEALRVWEECFYSADGANLSTEFLRVIEALVEATGLEVAEKQILEGLRAPDGWVKIGLKLSGQADFFTVIAFLNHVYANEKYINVERVQLSTEQSRKILYYDLTLTTLALKESAKEGSFR